MNEEFNELKAGDKVFVSNRYDKYITTVKRITPKGFIVVDSANGEAELTFKPNGFERSANLWSTTYLTHWTQEAEEEIQQKRKRTRLLSEIETVRWRNLDDDKLQRIAAILNEGKSEVRSA